MLASVREFVRKRVVPIEAEIDEKDEVPTAPRDECKAMGLYGFAITPEYGGLGLPMSQEVGSLSSSGTRLPRRGRCSAPTTASPATC